MNKHDFCLCPLRLAIVLNFHILKELSLVTDTVDLTTQAMYEIEFFRFESGVFQSSALPCHTC